MKISFSNGEISAVADTLGAELVSVEAGGREWLWQNESGEWCGHAPVLFPVCGKCAVQIGGKNYPLERHGFARECEFTLKRRSKSSLCFELRSSPRTRQIFPNDFVLRVRYTLLERRLRIGYEIHNPAGEPLYCSCGGHESFSLAKPLKNYSIRFSRPEKFEAHLHDDEGLLSGDTSDMGGGKLLPLDEEFLKDGNTLILSKLRSRRLWLCEGKREIAQISFPGFSNLLFWRPGNAQMICIEPWHNLPDRAGEPTAEFSRREGVFCIPPHATKKFVREIEYIK